MSDLCAAVMEEMALASIGAYSLTLALSVPCWCMGLRWVPDLTWGPRQKRGRHDLFQRRTYGWRERLAIPTSQALSYFRGFRIQEKERAAGQAGQSHCREDCPSTPVTLELWKASGLGLSGWKFKKNQPFLFFMQDFKIWKLKLKILTKERCAPGFRKLHTKN